MNTAEIQQMVKYLKQNKSFDALARETKVSKSTLFKAFSGKDVGKRSKRMIEDAYIKMYRRNP